MTYGLLFTSKDSKNIITANGSSNFLVEAGEPIPSIDENVTAPGVVGLFRTIAHDLPNGRPLVRLYDEYVFVIQPNSKIYGATSIYNAAYFYGTKHFVVIPYAYNKYSGDSNANYGIIAKDNTNNFTLSDNLKPLKIIDYFNAKTTGLRLVLLYMTHNNLTRYAAYDKHVGPNVGIIMESWKRWKWFGSMRNGTNKGYREYTVGSEVEYTSDYRIKINYTLDIKEVPNGAVEYRIKNTGFGTTTRYLHLSDSTHMFIPAHEFHDLAESIQPSNTNYSRGGTWFDSFYGNISDEIAVSIVDLN